MGTEAFAWTTPSLGRDERKKTWAQKPTHPSAIKDKHKLERTTEPDNARVEKLCEG